MHDVACEFARAVMRSKDTQKQLARTSLMKMLVATEKLYSLVISTGSVNYRKNQF